MALDAYRRVAGVPGFRRLIAGSLIARAPMSMFALALALHVLHGGGSYAATGLLAAAWAVGAGIAAPLLGRVVDRHGAAAVLVPTAVASAAATLALAITPGGDTSLLAIFALLSGATMPPMAPTVRSLWAVVMPDAASRQAAYAMEATLQELLYIGGPAIVAVLVTFVSPDAALAATGIVALAGTLLFATVPSTRRPFRAPLDSDRAAVRSTTAAGSGAAAGSGTSTASRTSTASGTSAGSGTTTASGAGGGVEVGAGRRRRLPSVPPGMAPLLVVGALITVGFDLVELSIAAITSDAGQPGVAGIIVGAWAFGSVIGGLVWGARGSASRPQVAGPVLLAAVAGTMALLPVAPGLVGLGVAIAVSGLAVAPAMACLYQSVERTAASRPTEAFGWLSTAFLVGSAIGGTAGGGAIQLLGGRHALYFGALALSVSALVFGLTTRRAARGADRPVLRSSEPTRPAQPAEAAPASQAAHPAGAGAT